MERGLIPVSGRRLLLVVFALTLAACQSQGDIDTRVVSGGHDGAPQATESKRGESSNSARRSQATDKRYFIEFRSRYALSYGHAYVVFGRLNSRGQMVDPEVAGLAPKSDDPSVYVAGHVLPVEASTGWTDGDLEEEYMTANWRIMLSKPEYDEVVAKIRKLQASSPVWHAALYNCNAFVADIARSMGYRTPGHWLRPRQFITRLREMNGGPDAIGSTAPTDRAPPGLARSSG